MICPRLESRGNSEGRGNAESRVNAGFWANFKRRGVQKAEAIDVAWALQKT